MSRVPIRLRLTAAFAGAIAVVLAVAGLLIYDHVRGSLDRSVNQGLQARTADVAALVTQADSGLRDARAAGGERFAQILDARGRVFDESAGLGRKPLLGPSALARARTGALLIPRVRHGNGEYRLLATPVTAQERHLVIVVGSSLKERDGALSGLLSGLLVGGPAALLLASLIGYLVAAAALRPVERMRTRARAISANRLSDRLPVGRAGDELSRLSETLNEMLAGLEAALVRERSFVADASHELRTPLAHLRAELELALERPRSQPELAAALSSVSDETDRLSQLADDLLLLARLDDGMLPTRLAPVELDDLFAGVAARFERRAAEAGREIETAGGGYTVTADRRRLDQALGNLVENALRYGAGRVSLGAEPNGDGVKLSVSDEGHGFPDDFLPRAFERFARADQSRASGGTGLGLAIVRAIAEAHGGTATAANPEEGGGEVAILLPHAFTAATGPDGTDRAAGKLRRWRSTHASTSATSI